MQIADSYVNIATYKHKLGDGPLAWREAMETALRYAEEAENRKLQVANQPVAFVLASSSALVGSLLFVCECMYCPSTSADVHVHCM